MYGGGRIESLKRNLVERKMSNIEIYGYISMIVVVISMMMKDIKWLRILNSISCAMFIIYGFLISAHPIIILNSIVIGINVFRLLKGE